MEALWNESLFDVFDHAGVAAGIDGRVVGCEAELIGVLSSDGVDAPGLARPGGVVFLRGSADRGDERDEVGALVGKVSQLGVIRELVDVAGSLQHVEVMS